MVKFVSPEVVNPHLYVPVINGITMTAVPREMLRKYEERIKFLYGRSLDKIAIQRGLTGKEILEIMQEHLLTKEFSAAYVDEELVKEVRYWDNHGKHRTEYIQDNFIDPVHVPKVKGSLMTLGEPIRSLKEIVDPVWMAELREAVDSPEFEWDKLSVTEQRSLAESINNLMTAKVLRIASKNSVLRADVASVRQKAKTLFDAVKHGDEAHQGWLKEAIDCHFNDEPMPDYVAGVSKSDAKIKELIKDLAQHQVALDPEVAAVLAANQADLYSPGEAKKFCTECACMRSGDVCPRCQTPLIVPAKNWKDQPLPDVDRIRALAKEVGYAIGEHGSRERDLDVIAAPWSDDAVSARDLLTHIASGLATTNGPALILGTENKPLGRLAATIQIDGWYKPLDISVCPRETMALAGWRLDWPNYALGEKRWCGVDDWQTMESKVRLGAVPISLWCDKNHTAPTSYMEGNMSVEQYTAHEQAMNEFEKARQNKRTPR